MLSFYMPSYFNEYILTITSPPIIIIEREKKHSKKENMKKV